MPNMKKSKSTDKMPARRMPEGFEFPKNKKTVPNPPGVQRTPTSGTRKNMPKTTGDKPTVKKPMPKVAGAKPSVRTPMAKTTTKAPAKMTPKPKVTKKPEKMTPQDAAMKKILEKKYGKIYG